MLKSALETLRKQETKPLVARMEKHKQQQKVRGVKKLVASSKAKSAATAGSKAGTLEEELTALPHNQLRVVWEVLPEVLQKQQEELELQLQQQLQQSQDRATEEQEKQDPMAYLVLVESVATLVTLLLEQNGTSKLELDRDRLFDLILQLHDQLLRLRANPQQKDQQSQLEQTQEAIALLCETCLRQKFSDQAHLVVTQLLPYLIVRSYETPSNANFNAKKHPIRRLFTIKESLLLLDFDDESSGLLRDILLRCFMQPNFFRSPDAVGFLSFLFQLHLPFLDDINETIRNQIPNQRKSILKKIGDIYFKAWFASEGQLRDNIEQSCIQRFVEDAVYASSLSLFNNVRTILLVFAENKRLPGVDEMLYRLCWPVLWRGVRAANDSVRRQAAVLMFDTFPLRDPHFNNETMDRTLQKQFDVFEELLQDAHPAVRIAAVHGVAKILSVFWELIPVETIRCFLSKLIVDLVHDAASNGVRAAVFEGLQLILDNHNSHAILKPLLPMLAPLINDRNEHVRAEFVSLLVRIKSIRNLHFYDVVAIDDLLDRLVVDRGVGSVRPQLIQLFLNSYFPQNVNGSSQVARCLAFIKKHPEAALVFYGHVVDQVSVGSVCKLVALLNRCSLNFVARSNHESQTKKSKSKSKRKRDVDSDKEDDDDEEEDEEEAEQFSIVTQIVVFEVMAKMLESVFDKVMKDECYLECKKFLAKQMNVDGLHTLIKAFSLDRPYYPEAMGAFWKVVGLLGELSEEYLLEKLVKSLMQMNDKSSQRQLHAMVDCLLKWYQLPSLLSKIRECFAEFRKTKLVWKARKQTFALHPLIALVAIERIVQNPTADVTMIECLDELHTTLHSCVEYLQSLSVDEALDVIQSNHLLVLRLVEVYAFLTVKKQCVESVSRSASLLQRKVKSFNGQTELLGLQPSVFFVAPHSLVPLAKWMSQVVKEVIDKVPVETPPSTKVPTRAKSKNKTTKNMSSNSKKRQRNGALVELEELAQLLARVENVLATVMLLIQECCALVCQNRSLQADSEPIAFLDQSVTFLCDTLETMHTSSERLSRSLFFQACQFHHLLKCFGEKKPAVPTWLKEKLIKWMQQLARQLDQAREHKEELWRAPSDHETEEQAQPDPVVA